MALYTFYPCKPNGTSETFTCLDLQDDCEAFGRAEQVLESHESCSQVVIWAGNRKVTTRHRVDADARAALSRP